MPTIAQIARQVAPARVKLRGVEWEVFPLADAEAERIERAGPPRPTGDDLPAMQTYVAQAEAAYAAAALRLSVECGGGGGGGGAGNEVGYDPMMGMDLLRRWRPVAVDAVRKNLTGLEIRRVIAAAEHAVMTPAVLSDAGKDSGGGAGPATSTPPN